MTKNIFFVQDYYFLDFSDLVKVWLTIYIFQVMLKYPSFIYVSSVADIASFMTWEKPRLYTQYLNKRTAQSINNSLLALCVNFYFI